MNRALAQAAAGDAFATVQHAKRSTSERADHLGCSICNQHQSCNDCLASQKPPRLGKDPVALQRCRLQRACARNARIHATAHGSANTQRSAAAVRALTPSPRAAASETDAFRAG
jgi:hypothetical protein